MTAIAEVQEPKQNGRVRTSTETPSVYHGVPVLRLHVGDPIPTPRAPQRYAVLVNPDLARYLLTFNHPRNRGHKPGAVHKYSRDMELGWWAFTPESIVFSDAPLLEDGQNRLRAVEESGARIWMMFDFGWPEDLIERINRGASRTNADAFAVNGYKNGSVISAGIGIVEKYRMTVGRPNRWANRILTSSESLSRYGENPTGWEAAAAWGMRVYNAVQGLGPSTWAAAHRIMVIAAGEVTTDAFFQELIDETGEVGSASRKLKSHYLRRRLSDTASGDTREPMENIVRAFNAWRAGKPVGFVRTGGAFTLSAVRP